MVKKSTGRVYLDDEEKKVLARLLEEWNGKPDKKARDTFVSAEALPRIQQLNLSKFGPDIISRDKAAKALWDGRVKVHFLADSTGNRCSHMCRRSTLGLRTTNLTRTGRSSSWKGKYP